MSKIKWCVLIPLAFLLMSCGTTGKTGNYTRKTYRLNEVQQVNLGAAILARKEVYYTEVWVGLFKSSSGYQKQLTADSFMQELIYTGRSGDTIHVSYKEFRRDFAKPAFFNELRYDLSQSNIIVFRNYRISIAEATNEYIRFTVLQD